MIKPTTIIHLAALIIAVVFHEVAHGWVAYKLGDPTAKSQGRLSLNPIKHVDPLGTIIVPLLLVISGASFLIGWAKPVPIQPQYFKHPIKGMMWVALAGPGTNIILAIVASIAFGLTHVMSSQSSLGVLYLIYFLESSIVVNVVLAVFNMIPVPPLDECGTPKRAIFFNAVRTIWLTGDICIGIFRCDYLDPADICSAHTFPVTIGHALFN
jgi:Zn-dependent protease